MDKPLILEMRDTKQNLLNIINDTLSNKKIPAYLVRSIVEEIFNSLKEIERRELELTEQAYNSEVEKEAN